MANVAAATRRFNRGDARFSGGSVPHQRQARAGPAARAAGQVVEVGQPARLGELRGGLAADAGRADEDRSRRAAAPPSDRREPIERDQARAGEVPGGPLAWLADVDDLDVTSGDQLRCLLGITEFIMSSTIIDNTGDRQERSLIRTMVSRSGAPPACRPRRIMRCSAATSASMSSLVLYGASDARTVLSSAEAPEDRLRAVVAGAHRDALLVERGADVLGAEAVEHERQHAGLVGRRADHAQARDAAAAARSRTRAARARSARCSRSPSALT